MGVLNLNKVYAVGMQTILHPAGRIREGAYT